MRRVNTRVQPSTAVGNNDKNSQQYQYEYEYQYLHNGTGDLDGFDGRHNP
jgi:hypothetical protein